LILFKSNAHKGTTINSVEGKNRILQQGDGIFLPKLDKVPCCNDAANLSNKIADWNIVMCKPGSFKVWLSSATRDTSALK
jgi:hypothetical protein